MAFSRVAFVVAALAFTSSFANAYALDKREECDCYTQTEYFHPGTVCLPPTNKAGSTCSTPVGTVTTTNYIPPHVTACATTPTVTLEGHFCPTGCPWYYTEYKTASACPTITHTETENICGPGPVCIHPPTSTKTKTVTTTRPPNYCGCSATPTVTETQKQCGPYSCPEVKTDTKTKTVTAE